jgi:hypothetical protein
VSGKPALPCPSWCAIDHGEDSHHQMSRPIGGSYANGAVALFQSDYGAGLLAHFNGEVTIHVSGGRDRESALFPVGQAEQLAKVAEALGRSDVAALIRELAALASGGAA